ncbi:MAG: ribosome biogenesis GTPase Der, partial [Gammaproteobacteria bacterium]
MTVALPLNRLPVIALVGRANVGKSTLFNVLTRSRDALVGDRPGVTRDRQYGFAEHGERRFIVCDTAGLSDEHIPLAQQTARQTEQALAEADGVLLLVDARAGPNAADDAVVRRVRESGKPAWLVANKIDGLDTANAVAEFYRLGFGEPQPIAAEHGLGVPALLNKVLAAFPAGESPPEDADEGVRVAIVGRPNVGKSTLVNRLLGEERVLTLDFPGTTRDAIRIPFERDGRRYTLIDT